MRTVSSVRRIANLPDTVITIVRSRAHPAEPITALWNCTSLISPLGQIKTSELLTCHVVTTSIFLDAPTTVRTRPARLLNFRYAFLFLLNFLLSSCSFFLDSIIVLSARLALVPWDLMNRTRTGVTRVADEDWIVMATNMKLTGAAIGS